MRLIRRLLTWRMLYRLCVLTVVAAAWGYWWLWPARPMMSYRFEGPIGTGFVLRKPTQGAIVGYRIVRRNPASSYEAILIRLTDGAIIWRQEAEPWSAISPDGQYAILESALTLHIVDTSAGRELGRITGLPQRTKNYATEPRLIRFSASGSRFAVKTDSVEVYETATLKRLGQFPAADAPFDLSPDGCRVLAAGALDAREGLVLWDVDNNQRIIELAKPTRYKVVGVGFHPHSSKAAVRISASPVGTPDKLQLWDLRQRSLKESWDIPSFASRGAPPSFALAGNLLYTSGSTPQLFDLRTNPPTDFYKLRELHSALLDFSAAGNRYLVSQPPLKWTVYDSDKHEIISRGTEASMSFAEISADGQWIIARLHAHSNSILHVVQKYVGRRTASTQQMKIVSANDGRTHLQLADRSPVCFDPNGSGLWTMHHGDMDPVTFVCESTLELWPLERAVSPWWLWALSACGLVWLIWDITRRRRHSNTTKLSRCTISS